MVLEELIHTFSGRVSTLKCKRPELSARTTATDMKRTRDGFLAIHDPYDLRQTIGNNYNFIPSVSGFSYSRDTLWENYRRQKKKNRGDLLVKYCHISLNRREVSMSFHLINRSQVINSYFPLNRE